MSGVIIMASRIPSGQVSRLPPLPDPPADPLVQEMFADTRARGGEVINLHLVMAHAPAIMRARRTLANALRYEAATSRALRELAIVRTAQIVGGEYELNQHVPMALAAGLTQPQLDAVASWRASTLFDERQRALLAYVEAVAQGGDVDDATYESFARHFTPQEIVELTTIVASYYGTGLFAKALRIAVDAPGRRTAP
jgi:AhpD family alkylhydroperoxidase